MLECLFVVLCWVKLIPESAEPVYWELVELEPESEAAVVVVVVVASLIACIAVAKGFLDYCWS